MKITVTRIMLVTAVVLSVASGCGENSGSGAAPDWTAVANSPLAKNEAARAEFAEAEKSMLNASHIMIAHTNADYKEDAITRSEGDALALALEIAKKAQAPDADFAALARKYSDASDADEGGRMGSFAPSNMSTYISDAVRRLAIGEVSDPVQSEYGFHILKRHR